MKSSVTHLITIFRNGKRKETIFECFENGKVEERKRGEKKEADRDYYRGNRDRKIAKVEEGRRKLKKPIPVETRQVLKARAHKTKGAQRKKEARETAKQKRDKIQQQTRDRVRKLRERRQYKTTRLQI